MRVALHGLKVRFGEVQALAGVDLCLEPGEVTVLAGPNGAGKSTCLGVLLGLVPTHAGRIEVDGRLLQGSGSGMPRAFLAQVGYLPERVAFAQTLTGRQALRFHAWARGVDAETQVATLARVGLADAANRVLRGYSRGMLQRLGLAVAILHDPALLVLDEPTGGLDQQGLDVLWSILAERKAAGRTTAACTHDLTLMERHADQLVVFSKGHICAAGRPAQLRLDVGLPVVVTLHCADAVDAAAWVALATSVGATPMGQSGADVRVSVRPPELLPLLERVGAGAPALRDLRVEEPGLDEVYQALLDREGPWSASSAR